MGTRIVFEIMPGAPEAEAPAVVLFANNSHPEIDPAEVFCGQVDNAHGTRAELVVSLLTTHYPSSGGVHRIGSPMFHIASAPYGDYEEVVRLDVDGIVKRLERSEYDPAALAAALGTALDGVADLLANWESGDLAAAVNRLGGWADDTFAAFPDLDAERWIAAADLKPGDRVDMEGVYAADSDDAHAAEFEYCRVIGVERETPACVRVDFDGAASFGFAPDRRVKAICTAKDRAAFADAAD